MTNEMLAQNANYALASAALVITVAMLCYALYLAQSVPVRERAESTARVPATVGGGAGEVFFDQAAVDIGVGSCFGQFFAFIVLSYRVPHKTACA